MKRSMQNLKDQLTKDLPKAGIYLGFVFCVSLACYLRSVDNLDRFVYDALIRGRNQSVEATYRIVKHESPRAEASSVLDSAEHLGQLEPLYAIRPLYIECLSGLSSGLGPQTSISALSAISFFFLGTVLLVWTRNPLLSGLMLISPAVLSLGRLGTPDSLSTLLVVSGIYLLYKEETLPAVLLLLISIWVRTDNVLITLAILGCLAWEKQMRGLYAGLLGVLALATVTFINHYAGNYGYLVLFRYCFIGGKYPAEIAAQFSVGEYSRAFLTGLQTIFPQSAPWILLGSLAWRWMPLRSSLLFAVAAAATLHFALFPSPEARYLTWAYLVCGAMFVVAAVNRSEARRDDERPLGVTSLAA